LAWVAAFCVSAIILILKLRKNGYQLPSSLFLLPKLDFFSLVFLLAVSLIVLAVGVTAFLSPPNTWDVLTYHMARVAHWIQNHGVSNYATMQLSQLVQPPGAEFIITHFQILSGSDYFANSVQWFSMLCSIIAATLVASQFGANRQGQILTAVVCATIPMGILQASGSKNDYVVSFWILSFIYFFNRYRKDQTLSGLLAASLSLGLAYLTKASAYIFLMPFLFWFFIFSVYKKGLKFWKPVCLMLAVIIAVNFGQWLRLVQLFGSPLTHRWDDPVMTQLKPEILTFASFMSNVIRNIGLHLGTPNLTFNDSLYHMIQRIHEGLGISAVDPRTTYEPNFPPGVPYSYSELSAGNFLHLILLTISAFLIFNQKQLFKNKNLVIYTVSLIAAFLLFCLLVKCNSYHSRTHLPLFVMWAPVIGLLLGNVNRKLIAYLSAILLILYSVPFVLFNEVRALAGKNSMFKMERSDRYFNVFPNGRDDFLSTAPLIRARRYQNIGLSIVGDHLEYLFWVFLEQENSAKPRIEHIDVDNISSKFADKSFKPDIVIFTRITDMSLGGKYQSHFGHNLSRGIFFVFTKDAL